MKLVKLQLMESILTSPTKSKGKLVDFLGSYTGDLTTEIILHAYVRLIHQTDHQPQQYHQRGAQHQAFVSGSQWH